MKDEIENLNIKMDKITSLMKIFYTYIEHSVWNDEIPYDFDVLGDILKNEITYITDELDTLSLKYFTNKKPDP